MSTTILKKLAVKYILAAMISWIPFSSQLLRDPTGHWIRDAQGLYVKEDETHARQRYEDIAMNIVDVAFDYTLPSVFPGPDGDIRMALLLASIGSLEGGYHEWVGNGDCNKKDWEGGGCDGGHAFTIFQIHVYDYMIKDDALTQARYVDKAYRDEHTDEIIKGKNLIEDPRLGVLVAYYIIRSSMITHRSLCAYSGESCIGKHPKADARLERAKAYLKDHPFVVPTADELELMETEGDLK